MAEAGDALQEEDAVPPRLTAMGKGLFSLYSLEAELAALEQCDKLLAGVRSTATGARELDFTLGNLTLHVELSARQLSGQVVPTQMRSPGGVLRLNHFGRARAGLARLRPGPKRTV